MVYILGWVVLGTPMSSPSKIDYSNWSNFLNTLHILQDWFPLNNSPMNLPIWNLSGLWHPYLRYGTHLSSENYESGYGQIWVWYSSPTNYVYVCYVKWVGTEKCPFFLLIFLWKGIEYLVVIVNSLKPWPWEIFIMFKSLVTGPSVLWIKMDMDIV